VSVINLNEQEFSLCVDWEPPQEASRPVRTLNRALILTLWISILLHIPVFLLKPFWYSNQDSKAQSIEISLEPMQIVEPSQTDKIETTAPPIEKESISLPLPDVVRTTSKTPEIQSVPETQVAKPIELLSAEDYSDIVESKDKGIATDSLAFNPHLKQQLQATNKLKRDKNKQSISWQDAGGNSFYKSGNKCFMSPAQNATSPVRGGANWYMVRCPGKTESEKMIDNVNREMKMRFSRD